MLRIKRMLLLVLLILSLLSPLAHANPPTFGVDDIVEAIKLEVMGAQAIESGSPKVQIDRFDLTLKVVAAKTSQGDIEFEVPGIDAVTGQGFSASAAHIINIGMSLSEETPMTVLSSNLGILPAIRDIKTRLRSAFNAPPPFKITTLAVTLEFAVVSADKQKYTFEIIEARRLNYKAFATHTIVIHMSVAE